MRRWIALLVGATAVFVGAARPVAAAPGAPETPASTASVPPDAVGVSLSQVAGSGLAVTLDPGASEEHDLVVSNHTANLRLTVKLVATDATGKLGAAAASWLAFGDDTVQLDPHAATTVPMTIAVPHDTQPGSALAHVNVSVESAVAAADGTPVAGTAQQTFPVSVSVRGTPTAQIAIADVHRVDSGSQHQLAVVLRNFGDQGAQVSGHVRVAGDHSQTLPFQIALAPQRDTTVDLDWNAPPVGTASDVAVDVEYGGGNAASWSSRLGGAPTDLSPHSAGTTPTTSASTSGATTAAATSGTAGSGKPLWKQSIATILAILALLGAASWFGFEFVASRRRRRDEFAAGPVGAGAPGWAPPPWAQPGWVAAPSADTIDLARQLVRLTDVIVQLVETQRATREFPGEPARARSPDIVAAAPAAPAAPVVAADAPAVDLYPVGAPPGPAETGRLERDDVRDARAGPAPPQTRAPDWLRVADPPDAAPPQPDEPDEPVEPVEPVEPEPLRSAALPSSDVARPEPVEAARPEPVDDAVFALFVDDEEPEPQPTPEPAPAPAPAPEVRRSVAVDPRAAVLARLTELDRQRRKLRGWMDAEESGAAVEPPEGADRYERTTGDSS